MSRKSKQNRSQEISVWDNRKSSFVCTGCGRTYRSRSSHIQHTRYYCRNKMGEVQNRRVRLNNHFKSAPDTEIDVNLAAYILIVMADRTYPDTESASEEERPDSDIVDGIRITYSTNLGVYKCICGSALTTRGSVRRHLEFSCVLSRPIKQYRCDRCSKTYTQRQSLNRHQIFFCKYPAMQ